MEGRDTIADTEIDITCGPLHRKTTHILTGGQTVSVHMSDPLLVVALILPDTQGRTAPQVTELILLDTADHLTNQGLCPRIRLCRRLLPIIEV